MFYLYILRSDTTLRYYTGSTEDLPNRVQEHNSGENKSTRHGIPWRLVHLEAFATRPEAEKKK